MPYLMTCYAYRHFLLPNNRSKIVHGKHPDLSDSSISIWLRSYGWGKTAILGCGHFQAFCAGFRICHIRHVVCHGHFTLKQLRLSVLNEMHANSYTGPRLISDMDVSICSTTILETCAKISFKSHSCNYLVSCNYQVLECLSCGFAYVFVSTS